MAIGPILHQGVIQRSQDIGQVKQNQDAKPLIDQTNIQAQFNKEAEHNTKQVTKYNETELKENRFDSKEKGKGSYFSQKREKREKNDKDNQKDKVVVKGTSSFDVKI